MNKSAIVLSIFLSLHFSLWAQKGSSCPEDLLPKFGQNRQWGYTNIVGQWVINPIYTKVSPYVENKAVVMKGLQYGVIDCEGNVILPPVYELLSNYRYGKIWAKQKGLWSLINDKGKVLMVPQFTEISPIANTELTWVQKEGNWGLFNEQKGNFICKPQFKMAQIMSENASLVEIHGRYGVVNHVNCQFLIPAEITKVKKVAPRLIVFQQKEKWGLFNEIGIVRLNPEFDTLIVKFHNVLQGKKGSLSGLYDLTGKELLAPVYDWIGDYSEGYFPIKKNGKLGYASRFGKVFIEPKYEEALPFKNQSAIVRQGDHYGIIDIRNKMVVPAKYGYIGRNYETGYFVIREKDGTGKNKYYFMNKNFKKAIESGFDTIVVSDTLPYTRVLNDQKYSFFNTLLYKNAFTGSFDLAQPFQYHLAKVMNNGRWGVINESGQAIVPLSYDSVQVVFWGGRLMIQTFLRNKQGISDESGKVILKNEFDLISYVSPNFLKLKKDNKYGVMKTTGVQVVPFEYDFFSNHQEHPSLPDWPAVAGKSANQFGLINEKGELTTDAKYSNYKYLGEKYYGFYAGKYWSLMNAKGERIQTENYEEIFPFSEGKLAVRKGKKWGFINSNGAVVVPLEYEEVSSFENKLAVVKKNGKYGVINNTGRIISEPVFESFTNGPERILIKEGTSYKLGKSGEIKQVK